MNSMKLSSIILLSVAVVFSVAGIHRVMVQKDIVGNYWIFMVSFICLMLYRYVNRPAK
jgi:hypothetical protein